MIQIIEEHSLNAWPAHQSLLYDGWVLRFAAGYTRRANSVNPIYASRLDPGEKIAACEAAYTAQGQPTIFKITPIAQPGALDGLLAARGYRKEAQTSVQVLEPIDAALGEPHPRVEVVCLDSTLSEAWIADYVALNGVKAEHVPAMRRLLENILPERRFVSVKSGGRTVAMALGVLERGYLGIYDVVTAPDQRRQGFGAALMGELLSWSCAQGACRAYLQVMLDNAPALALYAGLGFREVYPYWYRVRPKSDT